MATSEVVIKVSHLGKDYYGKSKTNFDPSSTSILKELEYQASYRLRDVFRDIEYDLKKSEVRNPFAWS